MNKNGFVQIMYIILGNYNIGFCLTVFLGFDVNIIFILWYSSCILLDITNSSHMLGTVYFSQSTYKWYVVNNFIINYSYVYSCKRTGASYKVICFMSYIVLLIVNHTVCLYFQCYFLYVIYLSIVLIDCRLLIMVDHEADASNCSVNVLLVTVQNVGTLAIYVYSWWPWKFFFIFRSKYFT